MDDFWSYLILNNTVKNWTISLSIIIGVLAFSGLMYKLLCKVLYPVIKRTRTKVDDILIEELDSPVIFAFVVAGFSIAMYRLTFSERADEILRNILNFVIVINVAWILIRTTDVIMKEYLLNASGKSNKKLNQQLIPLLRQATRFILWSIAIIVGLNNAGQDVAGLIAGLGIGGLAVALAAQDTVKNIFGGITIFLDKPFRISERIKIDVFEGVVEEIGMRRTRIRTSQGRLVTIPNSLFSEKPIENISREPSTQVRMVFNLSITTSPEHIQEVYNTLLETTRKFEAIDQTKTQVYFSGYTGGNLSITLVYYIQKGKNATDIQSEVNREIMERLRESKVVFSVA